MICKILLLSTLVGCASAIQCISCTNGYMVVNGQNIDVGEGTECTSKYCESGCIVMTIGMTMTAPDGDVTVYSITKDCDNPLLTCEGMEEALQARTSGSGSTFEDITCDKKTCSGTDNCNEGSIEEEEEGTDDYEENGDNFVSGADEVLLSTAMLGAVLFKLF